MWSLIQDPALDLACPAMHSGHRDCPHFSKSSRFFFIWRGALPILFYAWLTVPTSAMVLTENFSASLRDSVQGSPARCLQAEWSTSSLVFVPVTVLLLPLLARLLCVAAWSPAVLWVNTHRWPYNNSIHLCFIDGESLVQRGHVSSLWSRR